MKLLSSLFFLIAFTTSAVEQETAAQEPPVAEKEQAISWLTRLSESLKQRNFSTSFVVVKNNQAEPYHWFHGVSIDNDKKPIQLEILALLNGPRRDILRKGNIVSYIEPELPPYSVVSAQISGPIPAIFSGDIAQLQKNYHFVSVGRSRILGRAAQLIRIVSKDQHRFGYWLWLDQQSGLMLKMAVLTRKGKLLEQIQFTHLDLSPSLSDNLLQLQATELPEVIDIPSNYKNHDLSWQANWLPEGFKPIKSNRHRINSTKQAVEFILFSDDLVDISVYVSPSQDKYRAAEIAMDGATVVLNQVNKGFEVSVVGKIPSSTAKKIADSVTFSNVNTVKPEATITDSKN